MPQNVDDMIAPLIVVAWGSSKNEEGEIFEANIDILAQLGNTIQIHKRREDKKFSLQQMETVV